MLIFDDIEHDLAGVPAHTEPHFSYLNRSNRLEAERVRELLEEWIARYPEVDRTALIVRLRSQNNDTHTSAFFELALHELLLRTNHKILAIEPSLEHTTKRPDFLVESADGTRFYLEAVLSTDRSKDDTAAQNRLNQAIEEIDQRQTPAHFLELNIDGVPSQPISLKKLRNLLDSWIATLPQGKAVTEVEPFIYIEHGAQFEVRAFPRNVKKDEAPSRAVGFLGMEIHISTPGDGIREAVDGKASRYGKLDAPYVVAVNALGTFQNEENAKDALLGSPCVIVTQYSDGHSTMMESREPNGVWRGPNGPRKTGLSAVLSVERLSPWSIGQRRGRIFRNPWTNAPLPQTGLRLDDYSPVEGILQRSEGESFAQIFGLSKDWPE